MIVVSSVLIHHISLMISSVTECPFFRLHSYYGIGLDLTLANYHVQRPMSIRRMSLPMSKIHWAQLD